MGQSCVVRAGDCVISHAYMNGWTGVGASQTSHARNTSNFCAKLRASV